MNDITVIIPVYNVEDYVEECLQSVAAQTMRPHEVLIVNDGTRDNSREICQRYADEHDWITIIDQENKGLSEARNTGLEHASGNFIVFIDSDDYVAPDMLAVLHEKIVSTGADMVKCGTISFEDTPSGRKSAMWRGLDGKEKGDRMEMSDGGTPGTGKGTSDGASMDAGKKTSDGGSMDAGKGKSEAATDTHQAKTPDLILQDVSDFFEAFFEKKLIANVWNAIYRKELFHGLRFVPDKIMEDNFITPQLLRRCRKIVIIPEGLYYYRQRPGAIMHSFDNRHFDIIESDLQLKKILIRNRLFDTFDDKFYSWYGFHLLVMMKNAARYSGYFRFRGYAQKFHSYVSKEDLVQILSVPDNRTDAAKMKRMLREFRDRPTRFWLKIKVDSFKKARRKSS